MAIKDKKYLKVFVLCVLLVDSIDECGNLTWYTKSIKMLCNKLIKVMSNFVDEVFDNIEVYGPSTEFVRKASQKIDGCLEEDLSSLT